MPAAVTVLGTAALGHGSGALSIATLGAGAHSITVAYGGNGSYDGSTSNSLIQVVTAASGGGAASSTGAAEMTVPAGGHRGDAAGMAAKIAAAQQRILSAFLGHQEETDQIAQGEEPADESGSAHSAGERALARKEERLQALATQAREQGLLLAYVQGQPVIFSDVKTAEWYAPFVSALVAGGIAEGYKDAAGNLTGTFGVAAPVTRAEVLKMALEAAGKPLPKDLAPQNRTARGTWAEAYVREAEDLRLTVFATNPDVNAPASRGEVVQTVLEVMGFPIGKTPSSFADVPQTHPDSPAIGLAAYYGFVQGDTGPDGKPLNRFRPDDSINRAEVAKLIALVREVAWR